MWFSVFSITFKFLLYYILKKIKIHLHMYYLYKNNTSAFVSLLIYDSPRELWQNPGRFRGQLITGRERDCGYLPAGLLPHHRPPLMDPDGPDRWGRWITINLHHQLWTDWFTLRLINVLVLLVTATIIPYLCSTVNGRYYHTNWGTIIRTLPLFGSRV